MRADRLLQIVILLQTHGKMTTKELADVLEVSERTVLRDMDALSTAGYPILSERGRTGGWKLVDSFRRALSMMKWDDLKALFIFPSEKVLKELGMGTGSADIRQKLLAAMPAAFQSDALPFLEKIHIDTDTWQPAKDKPAALTVVQQALWDDRKLLIRYQKANGELSDRIVCPLGLVLKGSTWYLVALNENEEFRSFRISRISNAEMLDEGFQRPLHFRLSDYWHQQKREFVESLPAFEVNVSADPSLYGRMTFTDRFVRIIELQRPSDHGWMEATLQFHSEREAVEYVLGFGDRMKIRQPQYLKEKIAEQARRIVQMYDGAPQE